MFLIDGANTIGVMPARGAPGALPGWFLQNPGVGPGTVVTGEWLNMVQAEFKAILDAAAIAPDKANDAQVLAALRASVLNLQVVAVTGNFIVPAAVYRLMVEVWAGAGGGAGSVSSTYAPGAGGGGGYALKFCAVTPGQVIPCTVGLGGLGGTAGGGTGGTGGTTSFGAFCSATGGLGGQSSTVQPGSSPGGAGGNGVGGDLNLAGTSGFFGTNFSSGGGAPGPGGMSRAGGSHGGWPGGNGGAGFAGDPGVIRVWW